MITSKNKGDYSCLTTYTGWAENKLKSHEDACKNHSYCHTKVPEEQNNTFKNPWKRVISVGTDFLLEKIATCHNNPQEFYTTNISKHTACGYSLLTHCSFDSTKSKHAFYREDPMKSFCKDLRKHPKEINCEKIVTLEKESRK